MTVDVRDSLLAPRLIPQAPEVYSRVLTSVTLRGFELVNIGEQTQGLTTELPPRVHHIGIYANLVNEDRLYKLKQEIKLSD